MSETTRPDTLTFATRGLPMIDHGDGVYLYDDQGNQYLDGSGGPAVYCLGHRHPEVTAAIKEQLDRIAHAYRYHFNSEPLIELQTMLARLAGGTLNQMVLSSSGSEAVEGCLSIAIQYHHANGEPGRQLFISRERAYHGSTFGALALTGFAQRKFPYTDCLVPAHQVSTPNLYRLPAGVPANQLVDYYADELEAKILELGPERVAGFVFEPVVGASMGVMPAPEGYAQRMRAICDRYGVLMIADEVMCGCGRTGPWRALEHDGVQPDLMAIAKGLGGGYVPLGATMFTEQVGQVVRAAHGELIYGHTFSGHTAACAAALAVQKVMVEENLIAKVAEDGVWFGEQLAAALGDHPHVGHIRGRGMFWGVEFVAERDSQQTFSPDLQLTARFRQQALANRLVCYPVSGFVNHQAGDAAILAPSYLATREELAAIINRFTQTCEQLFDDLPG
ncbi:MAG: aminotransferase class III-fold pyridoxal phosphate-dependent enzyme [Anaerolineales bacterium]|nr:aminotransferase class III-fold pyridoxal phosphate-dependent enzyme [Anaerolineales bacterium]